MTITARPDDLAQLADLLGRSGADLPHHDASLDGDDDGRRRLTLTVTNPALAASFPVWGTGHVLEEYLGDGTVYCSTRRRDGATDFIYRWGPEPLLASTDPDEIAADEPAEPTTAEGEDGPGDGR